MMQYLCAEFFGILERPRNWWRAKWSSSLEDHSHKTWRMVKSCISFSICK